MTLVAALVAAGCVLAEWGVVAAGRTEWERVTKPLATVSVGGLGVALGMLERPWGWLVLVGLAFGLVGDVALLRDSAGAFVGGLGSFLVGHLAYMGAYTRIGLEPGPVLWVAVAILLACLAASVRLLPAVWRAEGPAMAGPVAAYVVVLGVALLLAGATGVWPVMLGAALFVVSDTVIGMNRFVWGREHHLVVMVTYLLAQLGIVAGAALA